MKGRRRQVEGGTGTQFRRPSRFFLPASSFVSGFTLLEMIIVLVLIAILAAASLPAFDSAVNEHAVREDAHELAMMVRIAMVQSAEQHRNFVIDLTKNTMSLHAQDEEAAAQDDSNASLFQDAGNNQAAATTPLAQAVTLPNVDAQQQLDSLNKIQVPDPDKPDGWIDPAGDGTEWVFQPGELCPATKVRVVRGDAYLELDFAALTGDVDTEKYNFP
jgi:type II secretion system protein H